eukprot:CAMPEP_0171737118 /NCGR_PEP_ID=MMETSP0991-20121206/32719_1 /TAXON_ID=483369 /ORGANISM="non described non described, Strain CCMP2098" /LENGTH=267 /DNA_ID=CAMNT_0012334027 /DNA_START=117 /DNA_END=916 /DNA_ORIENTATION=-
MGLQRGDIVPPFLARLGRMRWRRDHTSDDEGDDDNQDQAGAPNLFIASQRSRQSGNSSATAKNAGGGIRNKLTALMSIVAPSMRSNPRCRVKTTFSVCTGCAGLLYLFWCLPGMSYGGLVGRTWRFDGFSGALTAIGRLQRSNLVGLEEEGWVTQAVYENLVRTHGLHCSRSLLLSSRNKTSTKRPRHHDHRRIRRRGDSAGWDEEEEEGWEHRFGAHDSNENKTKKKEKRNGKEPSARDKAPNREKEDQYDEEEKKEACPCLRKPS